MGLNTTPKTWTSPYVVTALDLNTEIRDAMNGLQATWTAYTPTWTAATTNPTLGNGTITGNYWQVGKTVHGRIILTAGSTTAFGTGAYSFGLPVAAYDANGVGASGWLNGLQKVIIGRGASTTAITVYTTDTSGAVGSGTGLASGHRVQISFTYEAA